MKNVLCFPLHTPVSSSKRKPTREETRREMESKVRKHIKDIVQDCKRKVLSFVGPSKLGHRPNRPPADS